MTDQFLVAFQGELGAYSEGATKFYFGSTEAGDHNTRLRTQPCKSFADVFRSVETGIADRGVVPVENSLGGSIHECFDLLVRHHLSIVGEIDFPVHHCLLAVPGVGKADIKRVYSHPQALAQCEDYIQNLGTDVKAVPAYDTAGSAKQLAEDGVKDAAAIASRDAAEAYGMVIVDEDIEDFSGNVTRFIVLSRNPLIALPIGEQCTFKTSIVIAMKEEPGILFRTLSVFAFRKIDLTRIESRPRLKLRSLQELPRGAFTAPGSDIEGNHNSFGYVFYVDFLCRADQTQKILDNLREMEPALLHVFGTYPPAGKSY